MLQLPPLVKAYLRVGACFGDGAFIDRDFNTIDPFHLEAYGEKAINYNRDVDAFPLLRRIAASSIAAPLSGTICRCIRSLLYSRVMNMPMEAR